MDVLHTAATLRHHHLNAPLGCSFVDLGERGRYYSLVSCLPSCSFNVVCTVWPTRTLTTHMVHLTFPLLMEASNIMVYTLVFGVLVWVKFYVQTVELADAPELEGLLRVPTVDLFGWCSSGEALFSFVNDAHNSLQPLLHQVRAVCISCNITIMWIPRVCNCLAHSLASSTPVCYYLPCLISKCTPAEN